MTANTRNVIALGDGLRVCVEVESASSQGLRVRSVDVRRTRNSPHYPAQSWVPWQMRASSRRLTLKGEKLEVVDYDPIRELGLLRTEPKLSEPWKEYFELSLDQGFRMLLRRFAFDPAQGRKREIAFGLSQDQLLELVDELGQVLNEAPERREVEPLAEAA